MEAVVIITLIAAVLILDVKRNGAWQIVRVDKLTACIDEIDRLRYKLAMSGNENYLADARVALSNYYNVCRERDITLAENDGLKKKCEVLEMIIQTYRDNMNLTHLEETHGIINRHDVRNEHGAFVTADGSESKNIRAYRMDVEGIDRGIIGEKLGISLSSVKTYVNAGRRELAARDGVIVDIGGGNKEIFPADYVSADGVLYDPESLDRYRASWDEWHKQAFFSIRKTEKNPENIG